jgi:hypothetical protein
MELINKNQFGLLIWGTKGGLLSFIWDNILDSNSNEFLENSKEFFDILKPDPRPVIRFPYIDRSLFVYGYEIKEFHNSNGKKEQFLFYTIYRPIKDWVGRPGFYAVSLIASVDKKVESEKIPSLLKELSEFYWSNYLENKDNSIKAKNIKEDKQPFLDLIAKAQIKIEDYSTFESFDVNILPPKSGFNTYNSTQDLDSYFKTFNPLDRNQIRRIYLFDRKMNGLSCSPGTKKMDLPPVQKRVHKVDCIVKINSNEEADLKGVQFKVSISGKAPYVKPLGVNNLLNLGSIAIDSKVDISLDSTSDELFEIQSSENDFIVKENFNKKLKKSEFSISVAEKTIETYIKVDAETGINLQKVKFNISIDKEKLGIKFLDKKNSINLKQQKLRSKIHVLLDSEEHELNIVGRQIKDNKAVISIVVKVKKVATFLKFRSQKKDGLKNLSIKVLIDGKEKKDYSIREGQVFLGKIKIISKINISITEKSKGKFNIKNNKEFYVNREIKNLKSESLYIYIDIEKIFSNKINPTTSSDLDPTLIDYTVELHVKINNIPVPKNINFEVISPNLEKLYSTDNRGVILLNEIYKGTESIQLRLPKKTGQKYSIISPFNLVLGKNVSKNNSIIKLNVELILLEDSEIDLAPLKNFTITFKNSKGKKIPVSEISEILDIQPKRLIMNSNKDGGVLLNGKDVLETIQVAIKKNGKYKEFSEKFIIHKLNGKRVIQLKDKTEKKSGKSENWVATQLNNHWKKLVGGFLFCVFIILFISYLIPLMSTENNSNRNVIVRKDSTAIKIDTIRVSEGTLDSIKSLVTQMNSDSWEITNKNDSIYNRYTTIINENSEAINKHYHPTEDNFSKGLLDTLQKLWDKKIEGAEKSIEELQNDKYEELKAKINIHIKSDRFSTKNTNTLKNELKLYSSKEGVSSCLRDLKAYSFICTHLNNIYNLKERVKEIIKIGDQANYLEGASSFIELKADVKKIKDEQYRIRKKNQKETMRLSISTKQNTRLTSDLTLLYNELKDVNIQLIVFN